MERLEFGEGSHYSALEASIHLCRYLTAKSFCEGRRVLDIACGEGYGSALMSGWGAASVLGVDVSAHAVERAKANFSASNVRFVQSSGEDLIAIAGDEKFDLIVSLETVEHVDDPALFLRNLKSLLADGGVIVLSCPNDNWYFADGGSNPFHKHRWSATEFRRFSESVLGPASWAYGTFGMGFATYAEQGPVRVLDGAAPQETMVNAALTQDAMLTHMQDDSAPSPGDVSFFVGFWGADAPAAVFAGYPVSMDLTRAIKFTREDAKVSVRWAQDVEAALAIRQEAIDTLRARLNELEVQVASEDELTVRLRDVEDRLAVSERDKRQSVMLYRVAQSESELLRNQLGHNQYLVSSLSSEMEGLRGSLSHAHEQIAGEQALAAGLQAQLGEVPWRVVAVWRRLRRFVPAWMLKGVVRGMRAVRGGERT